MFLHTRESHLKLYSLIAVLLLSSNFAHAFEAKCSIKTNIDSELQDLSVEVSSSGHGPMSYFDTNTFTGFVSSARGFLVVAISKKGTTQSSSYHSKVEHSPIGVQYIDGNDWIQVNCQKI